MPQLWQQHGLQLIINLYSRTVLTIIQFPHVDGGIFLPSRQWGGSWDGRLMVHGTGRLVVLGVGGLMVHGDRTDNQCVGVGDNFSGEIVPLLSRCRKYGYLLRPALSIFPKYLPG
jgi:hypothetical protein